VKLAPRGGGDFRDFSYEYVDSPDSEVNSRARCQLGSPVCSSLYRRTWGHGTSTYIRQGKRKEARRRSHQGGRLGEERGQLTSGAKEM
jgi:hypothetical protein